MGLSREPTSIASTKFKHAASAPIRSTRPDHQRRGRNALRGTRANPRGASPDVAARPTMARAQSTVGGVVAANLSGPRRRLYGTARDMIIGMTFATLEGRLVQSGGMVVKNVAGLDMAKPMVGSFGTLAAIAVVNFKVFPMPAASRTFVSEFATAPEAFAERDRILSSVLQPSAIDIVNWPSGIFRLLIRVQGNAAVLDRFARASCRMAHVEDDTAWGGNP